MQKKSKKSKKLIKKEKTSLKEQLKKRMKKDSGYLITTYPPLYKKIITEMIRPFKKTFFDKIAAPEAKGWFYGPLIAYKLNKPFIPIFKSGRIPKKIVFSQKYKDYSKKQKSLDVGKITIKKGERILIVDDVLETGASIRTAIQLVEKLGGKVEGISVIYNKLNQKDEESLEKYHFHYLLKLK